MLPLLPATLLPDPTRSKPIPLNLVRNAVKLTSVGSMELRVHDLRRSTGQLTLRLDMIDTGISIAAGHHERIFESFTQAEASTTRLQGSTGLGLSIVRHLVQPMNGPLKLRSTPGAGSTFVSAGFDLPADHNALKDARMPWTPRSC